MKGELSRASAPAADGAAGLRRLTHVALYVAAATVVFVLERLIPSPLPWVRLGLANCVTLVVLFRLGSAPALWVQIGRVLLGAVFAGTLWGPAFLLALTGGLCSWLVMAGLRRGATPWFSLLGISVCGAVAHVLAQLAVVAFLFRAGSSVFLLLPLFLGMAVVTGAFIGIVAEVLLRRILALHAPASP